MSYKKTLILGGVIAANSLSLNTSARQDFNLGDSDAKTELPAIRNDEKDIMSALIFFEGFSKVPYRDCVGIWTNAIGMTKLPGGKAVTEKDTIRSFSEAKEATDYHLETEVNPAIEKYISAKLNSKQRAALTSLVYNCGPEALGTDKSPTKLALAINHGNQPEIEKCFMKYCYAGGKYNKGLAVRRYMEAALYKGLLDFSDFYICSYGELASSYLIKNGKPDFSRAKLDYVKKICMQAPSREKTEKFAWFGYGTRVKDIFMPENAQKPSEILYSQVSVNKRGR